MDDIQKKLDNTIEWLRGECATIRTGQANPGLLDGVRLESYGTKVPINQVASVGVENARTLRVSVWDNDTVAPLEQAILEADLGVGVSTDSQGLRVTFPELTSERRDQLLKLAKQRLEEARVRVRGIRDEKMKSIDSRSKAKEIGEDEAHKEKEATQKEIDETNNKLESLYEQKEKEIKE